jgi:hypothetical protein
VLRFPLLRAPRDADYPEVFMLPANDTPEFQALLHEQVEKRRTFAIISHPDAGKTTLT